LTKGRTETVDFPHEPGESATIRMLSWKQLEDAKDATVASAFKLFENLSPQALEAITNAPERPGREAAEAKYDRATLLEAGVVTWSYQDPVDAETIADLDDVTAELLEQEILALSRRTEAEGEA